MANTDGEGRSVYPFVGPRHAGRMLGIHENTVRNWVHEGRLTNVTPEARFIHIAVSQIEEMLAGRPRALLARSASGEAPAFTHTAQFEVPGFTVFTTITLVPVEVRSA